MLQQKTNPKTPLVPIEVELTLKTTAAYMELLQNWLKKNAQFQGTEKHKEVYLDNPKTTFFFTKPNGERDALQYLRVRWSNENGSICLKDWHRDKTGKTTHCDEYETDVTNPKILLQLLEQLGYTNQTWVEKTRNKFLSGDYEIVIDEVKNLGTFFEIEMKCHVEDPCAALKRIENFLANTIGIKEYWIQTRGYVSMLRNPEIDVSDYRKHNAQ